MTAGAPPRVQVQIVTYNSERWIERCLRAVFSQTVRPHRVLVIDNDSVDNTCAIVTEFSGVDLIQPGRNLGFSAAHNLGIRSADAEFILVLNPDVELTPPYLEQLLGVAQADPSVGALQGKLLRMNEEGIPEPLLDSTGIRIGRDRRATDRGSAEEDRGQYDVSGPVFGVTAAAALYRRQMLDTVRYQDEFFDEDFFMYKEDVDLSWRARLAGWSCYYEASAVAYHYRGWREGSRLRQPKQLRVLGLRNRYLLLLKNDAVGVWLRHLLWVLATEAAILGYMVLRDRALFAAWPAVWRLWPRMKEKRRALQRQLRSDPASLERWFV